MKKFYDTQGHSYKEYEKSHGKRFDFLFRDLELYKLENVKICEFGFGLGHLYSRFNTSNNNVFYVGVDYTEPEKIVHLPDKYFQKDLNLPFADDVLKEINGQVDIGFFFESCEHLTNPYNALIEIKKIIKLDGILYLSIPAEDANHPYIYPKLFNPTENFQEFLEQMAFKVEWKRVHRAAFSQVVFKLINKDWSYSKMTVYKTEDKFRNIEPLVYVNL